MGCFHIGLRVEKENFIVPALYTLFGSHDRPDGAHLRLLLEVTTGLMAPISAYLRRAHEATSS